MTMVLKELGVFLDEKISQQLEQIKELLNAILEQNIQFNIFSTNYDLLFDGIIPVQDITEASKIINIDKLINRKPYAYIPLKGCIDWAYQDEDRTKIVKGASYGIPLERCVYLGLENDANTLPSAYPHKELYEKFKKDLSTTEIFLAIGFSFRDIYLHQSVN